MELPERLSDRAYLLGYDPRRQRLTGRPERGHLLNAAVLTELWLAGAVTDENRRAAAVPAAGGRRPARPLPALEAEVLRRVAESGPRRWKHWVKKSDRLTEKAVRERLSRTRVIRTEDRSALGVIRWQRVEVRDPRLVKELVARCRSAVLDGGPLEKVSPVDAALVAMVAATELDTVFTGRERRAHRDRIKQLALRSGPAVKALRDVVSDDHASS